MVTVVREPSFGENLGSSFGTGIGQALQNLAAMKTQQYQQQQAAARGAQFWQQLGLPAESAMAFAQAPEAVQKSLLDRLEGIGVGQPMQQQAMAQPGQQALQQGQLPETGGIKIGANPIEKRHRETIKQQELAREQKEKFHKENLEAQEQSEIEKQIAPYLKEHNTDFRNSKILYKTAKRMLENIEKNKKKFPTLSALAPEELQAAIQRDPDIRDYMRDANQLVILLSNSRKGQPTNFKTKLEKAAKIDINQPIEAQITGLKHLIDDSKEVFERNKQINEIKKKHGGKYPRHIQSEIINRDAAEMDPLSYPDYYEEGTEYEDNGVIYTLKNGEWST